MPLKLADRLGIQSWCFRGLPSHEAVAAALAECGVAKLELSHAHLKPWEGPDPARVVDFYRSRGVTVSSYGAFGIGADVDRARKVFDFARVAAFPTITVMLAPGGLETAEALCAEYGKKVAVHNHGRHDPMGSPWALEKLFAESSPNIGLCLDTAWMLDSGADPVETARKFAPRLFGLHLKDFVFDRAGKPSDVVIGQGNLDLPALLRLLREIRFDGYLTLEYEGDKDDPVPATKKCVEAVRAAMAKL